MTVDKRKKKLAHAEAMVKTWERKLSLSITSLKKWNRRLRTIEKAIAEQDKQAAIALASNPSIRSRRIVLED